MESERCEYAQDRLEKNELLLVLTKIIWELNREIRPQSYLLNITFLKMQF